MRLLIALLFTQVCFASYKVGDTVPNLCWKDSRDKSHCLNDEKTQTKILLYNATWCKPCQAEFAELSRRILKRNVIYYSLTCDNVLSSNGLSRWEKLFNLEAHGIKALASPRDCGRDFLGSGSIPAVGVIGSDGRLKSFAINPGVDWILAW